jgi:hypothetical protein
METGETWELIFSDEFNNDGRTFYGGASESMSLGDGLAD